MNLNAEHGGGGLKDQIVHLGMSVAVLINGSLAIQVLLGTVVDLAANAEGIESGHLAQQ